MTALVHHQSAFLFTLESLNDRWSGTVFYCNAVTVMRVETQMLCRALLSQEPVPQSVYLHQPSWVGAFALPSRQLSSHLDPAS